VTFQTATCSWVQDPFTRKMKPQFCLRVVSFLCVTRDKTFSLFFRTPCSIHLRLSACKGQGQHVLGLNWMAENRIIVNIILTMMMKNMLLSAIYSHGVWRFKKFLIICFDFQFLKSWNSVIEFLCTKLKSFKICICSLHKQTVSLKLRNDALFHGTILLFFNFILENI
jgi:hypothetical protein